VRPSLESYRQLRWAARITTVGSVLLAVVYGLILCFAIGESPFYIAGVLVAGTFALAAFFIGIAIVAWQWSLVGGLFVLVAGGLALNGVLSTNYSIGSKAPFAAFCVIFMIGGVLYLIRADYLRKRKSGDD
jgi:hypothetical protein